MSIQETVKRYVDKHERSIGPVAGLTLEAFHLKRIPKKNAPSRLDKEALNLEQSKLLYKQLVDIKLAELCSIYSNAGQGGCGSFIVLGSGSIHNDEKLIGNLGGLNQHESGAVFNEKPWNLYKNDMMILGATKARKIFMICQGIGEIIPDSILSREIGMVLNHDYQNLPHEFSALLGTVLVPNEMCSEISNNSTPVLSNKRT